MSAQMSKENQHTSRETCEGGDVEYRSSSSCLLHVMYWDTHTHTQTYHHECMYYTYVCFLFQPPSCNGMGAGMQIVCNRLSTHAFACMHANLVCVCVCVCVCLCVCGAPPARVCVHAHQLMRMVCCVCERERERVCVYACMHACPHAKHCTPTAAYTRVCTCALRIRQAGPAIRLGFRV
jgi:hypothetical protein